MTTLSLKKPLGFETKLTLDAVQRGTVAERSATKRVVVVDRPPSRHSESRNSDSGRRDTSARHDFEPEFRSRDRDYPPARGPLRSGPDYDRPESDFRPDYRALERRGEERRGEERRPAEDRRAPERRPGASRPANPGRSGNPRGRDEDTGERSHVLWPPRVVVSDFDGATANLPRIAATTLELPAPLEAVHQDLMQRFPDAFPAEPLPLSLSIESALDRALVGTPVHGSLDAFLMAYRSHPAYLAAIVRNPRRVDLGGGRNERIEPEEREQALWTLRLLDSNPQ